MDSDAFSEDSEASGAEVRQMRLAHSDDSSEDEEDSRDEPDTISDAEVLLNLQFKTQLTYKWVFNLQNTVTILNFRKFNLYCYCQGCKSSGRAGRVVLGRTVRPGPAQPNFWP